MHCAAERISRTYESCTAETAPLDRYLHLSSSKSSKHPFFSMLLSFRVVYSTDNANHAVSVFLCLPYCAQHRVIQVISTVSDGRIFFSSQIKLYLSFIHLSVNRQFSCICILVIKNIFYLIYLQRTEFFKELYLPHPRPALWDFAICILHICTLSHRQRFSQHKLKMSLFVFKSP